MTSELPPKTSVRMREAHRDNVSASSAAILWWTVVLGVGINPYPQD